ncbi:hypothetical protein BGLA2_2130005 [Burkholderia gladioli]|nr:hypothetical protein BGLA2_2130005 [Burkholderia gladioli]
MQGSNSTGFSPCQSSVTRVARPARQIGAVTDKFPVSRSQHSEDPHAECHHCCRRCRRRHAGRLFVL